MPEYTWSDLIGRLEELQAKILQERCLTQKVSEDEIMYRLFLHYARLVEPKLNEAKK